MPDGWLLVRNAGAGADDEAAVAAARDELGPDAEVVATGGPGELDAALDRLDGRTLVLCGGDGSVHLGVERLRAADRLETTTLGVVPLGTGNDLAGSLGLPEDPVEAAAVVRDGTPRRLDLLVAGDGAVCVNALHAGVGVDAAERATRLKDALGRLAYPLGAMIAAAGVDGLDLEVTVDGRPVRPARGGRALMLAVANAATIGGGTPVVPDARPDDGHLDVMVSHAVAPAARAAFGTALASGTHLGRQDVVSSAGRSVSVRGAAIAYNVDGELEPDSRTERTWRVQPGAWTVVVPPR